MSTLVAELSLSETISKRQIVIRDARDAGAHRLQNAFGADAVFRIDGVQVAELRARAALVLSIELREHCDLDRARRRIDRVGIQIERALVGEIHDRDADDSVGLVHDAARIAPSMWPHSTSCFARTDSCVSAALRVVGRAERGGRSKAISRLQKAIAPNRMLFRA